MKLMARRAWPLIALCVLFAIGVVFLLFTYIMDAPHWAHYPVNRHLYRSGRLVHAGEIYDRNGALLAATQDGARAYHASAGTREALMHLTGDGGGNVATGLQVAYGRALTGWDYVNGTYSYDGDRGGLTATVDAGLCRIAYEALGGKRGAVGVMNYLTGELLCMVSSPSFDPQNPPDVGAERYEGVYLNRLLSSSFTPGSIFKLVTAAAAIENVPGLEERVFECGGRLELQGGRITCPKVHGSQSFRQAMTNSCNAAFAELANEAGAGTLTRYAEKAGFNETGARMGRIPVSGGSFSLDGASEAEIGWAGAGQHTTLLNPLSYLRFVGSVANGGRRGHPRVVQGERNLLPAGRSMSAETADMLKDMMRANVTDSYGETGLKGYNLCAKTGTAEVGGGAQPHSWYTGFLDSEDAPLCFIVLVEHGGAGGGAAAKIAGKVLAEAVKLMGETG